MSVQPITSLEEFQTIINSGKVVIIDLGATWCGPCKVVSPIFEEIARSSGDAIGFYKVDVDAVPDVSKECGIRAMPTFVAFKDGARIGEVVGANELALKSLVATHVVA